MHCAWLQVILNSLHKYVPRMRVWLHSHPDGSLVDFEEYETEIVKIFPETEFMAVTAYHNRMVHLAYFRLHTAQSSRICMFQPYALTSSETSRKLERSWFWLNCAHISQFNKGPQTLITKLRSMKGAIEQSIRIRYNQIDTRITIHHDTDRSDFHRSGIVTMSTAEGVSRMYQQYMDGCPQVRELKIDTNPYAKGFREKSEKRGGDDSHQRDNLLDYRKMCYSRTQLASGIGGGTVSSHTYESDFKRM